MAVIKNASLLCPMYSLLRRFYVFRDDTEKTAGRFVCQRSCAVFGFPVKTELPVLLDLSHRQRRFFIQVHQRFLYGFVVPLDLFIFVHIRGYTSTTLLSVIFYGNISLTKGYKTQEGDVS